MRSCVHGRLRPNLTFLGRLSIDFSDKKASGSQNELPVYGTNFVENLDHLFYCHFFILSKTIFHLIFLELIIDIL